MFVTPRARGRGHARRLLAELEGIARDGGQRWMRLFTTDMLPEAMALYASEGYTVRSSHPLDGRTEFWLEKACCNVCRSMPEQLCTVDGDVELCYETFGDPDAPAMLLTMGLATQMLGWHEDFCAELADRGFHVIRFDNRDVGRSQRMDGAGAVARCSSLRRDKRAASYTLEDMAGDGVGLLDHLGHRRRARGRRLDGRHDRPDDGGPAPGPGAVAGLDDVQHRRRAGAASRRRASSRVLLKPPPRDRERLHGPRRPRVLEDRLAAASSATTRTCGASPA